MRSLLSLVRSRVVAQLERFGCSMLYLNFCLFLKKNEKQKPTFMEKRILILFLSRSSLSYVFKSISLPESSKPAILSKINVRALFQGFPANLPVATEVNFELLEKKRDNQHVQKNTHIPHLGQIYGK